MYQTLAVVAVIVASALAQGNYFGSGDRTLSAFVRASYYSWQPGEIGLVVLWRGSERWYMQPSTGQGSGNFEGYRGSYKYGSSQVDFVFERQRRVARVNGVEVLLSKNDNVLLVDGVDTADGALSVRAIHADLAFTPRAGRGAVPAPPSTTDFVSILARSPEMVSFLQCDTPANATPARMTGYICEDLRAK